MICLFVNAPTLLRHSSPPEYFNTADDLCERIIEPALADFPEITFMRADHLSPPGDTAALHELLYGASLVIADVSDDPNLCYQIGLRQGYAKPIILLVSGDSDLPSDIKEMPTIKYGGPSVTDVRNLLASHISDFLARAAPETDIDGSPRDVAKRVSAIADAIAELRINSLSEHVQQLYEISNELRDGTEDDPEEKVPELTKKALFVLSQIDQALGSSKLGKLILAGAIAGLATGGGLAAAAVFTLSLAVWDGPAAFKKAMDKLNPPKEP